MLSKPSMGVWHMAPSYRVQGPARPWSWSTEVRHLTACNLWSLTLGPLSEGRSQHHLGAWGWHAEHCAWFRKWLSINRDRCTFHSHTAVLTPTLSHQGGRSLAPPLPRSPLHLVL